MTPEQYNQIVQASTILLIICLALLGISLEMLGRIKEKKQIKEIGERGLRMIALHEIDPLLIAEFLEQNLVSFKDFLNKRCKEEDAEKTINNLKKYGWDIPDD